MSACVVLKEVIWIKQNLMGFSLPVHHHFIFRQVYRDYIFKRILLHIFFCNLADRQKDNQRNDTDHKHLLWLLPSSNKHLVDWEKLHTHLLEKEQHNMFFNNYLCS